MRDVTLKAICRKLNSHEFWLPLCRDYDSPGVCLIVELNRVFYLVRLDRNLRFGETANKESILGVYVNSKSPTVFSPVASFYHTRLY
nr:hypothetical protein JQQKEAMO_JQQKEAMO_CDS_0008 [Microvirus sp.]